MFQVREFFGPEEGPHLLITGGVHGDEFEPMRAIRRLISGFEKNSPLQLLRGRVTFIPVVNEAAFLRGHRTAEDGLDLARICPGHPEGTVTERTAAAISERIREADLYIDLHTGGTELAVHPMCGYVLHDNPEVLSRQRRMARAFNMPIVWGTSTDKSGRTLSIARDADVPAIYAEYLGSASCNSEGTNAYVEGCLNVMAEFGMVDRSLPEPLAQLIAEDPRPDSGHMQVCNPSPMTGAFEPDVQLGEAVKAGDPLGTVRDMLGGREHEIPTPFDGVILVLRTFPRVRAGETVGVVLDTTNHIVPREEWLRMVSDSPK
ncbi:MAG: succinylglutamate desuccinylase/aspartoacylase family protein [Planctomycetaceae bacterium]